MGTAKPFHVWHTLSHPVQLLRVEAGIGVVSGAGKTPDNISGNAEEHAFNVLPKVDRDGLVELVFLPDSEGFCHVLFNQPAANCFSTVDVDLVLLHDNPEGVNDVRLSQLLCRMALLRPRPEVVLKTHRDPARGSELAAELHLMLWNMETETKCDKAVPKPKDFQPRLPPQL